VVARSETWVCGRSLAGIVGLDTAGGTEVSLGSVVCFGQGSLRRADHSSRGILPSVCVCVCVCLVCDQMQQ
jgi:hypothetical protein